MRRINLMIILLALTITIPCFAQDATNVETAPSVAKVQLSALQLPPGFSVNVYAHGVKDAREMALGDKGTVFVGSTYAGKVYAITADPAHRVLVIAKGLNQPNGVAIYKGALYVAEVDRIIRFDDIEDHLTGPLPPKVITRAFPIEDVSPAERYKQRHGWKMIGFSPDGWLYVAVGIPCDLCLPKDPRYGTIMRMRPNGSDPQIYVKGVRNSVGFDWDPRTEQFWFTDNGSDDMGEFIPPDHLDYAPVSGLDFGFPYYEGRDPQGRPIPTKYASMRSPVGITWPAYELPAHIAVLGMVFYTGKLFPDAYRQQIIIAEHGSRIPKKKVGYRLSLITLENNKVISYQPFITGWEKNNQVWGRPVALLVLRDGSLLVSDDYAGVIYRVTYRA